MNPVFAIRFDMRRAPFSPLDDAALYSESIAMSRWADEHGAVAVTEEYLQVLRQAFTGEAFEWRGRQIVVTPKPTSPMEALVWAGGSVAASARRAARLRLPLFTMSTNPAVGDVYRQACAEAGYEGLFMAPSGPSFVHVSEDPERTWAQIGEYALYDATTYATWQTHDHDNVVALDSATTVGDLEASGMWRVVTPEQAVELGRTHGAVALHPLMGGIPPELGWESMQLYVDKVAPQF